MMLALLLAAAPPSGAYIQLDNQGTRLGAFREVNCSGTGITCSLDAGSGFATFSVTATTSDGGSSVAVPNCDAGYVNTSDGGSFRCTNVVATATALASTPKGCDGGQYAASTNVSGDLLCSQVQYSQLGGSPLAGGSSPQMQYNNSGVLGGVSNFTSDGTHGIYAVESVPSAPSSGSLAFDLSGAPVALAARVDSFMGLPAPVGYFRDGPLVPIGTKANWSSCVSHPSVWNSTSFDVNDGCPSTALTTEGSTASGGGWASTNFTTRQRRVGLTTSVNSTYVGVHRGTADVWIGNAAGIGGFEMWARTFNATRVSGDAMFVGLAATTSTLATGSKPSQQVNSVYVGCDASDTNLNVCSNDNSGSATCNSLGSSFPCRTGGAIYDVWIASPPNGLLPDAGTGLGYYVERLDSPATAGGTITSDLPSNAIQLSMHVSISGPDAGSQTVKIEIPGAGTWGNQ